MSAKSTVEIEAGVGRKKITPSVAMPCSVYGVIDPDYARVFTHARVIAWLFYPRPRLAACAVDGKRLRSDRWYRAPNRRRGWIDAARRTLQQASWPQSVDAALSGL